MTVCSTLPHSLASAVLIAVCAMQALKRSVPVGWWLRISHYLSSKLDPGGRKGSGNMPRGSKGGVDLKQQVVPHFKHL